LLVLAVVGWFLVLLPADILGICLRTHWLAAITLLSITITNYEQEQEK